MLFSYRVFCLFQIIEGSECNFDNIYLLPYILIHCFKNQHFTTFHPLYPTKRILDGIGNCRIACI